MPYLGSLSTQIEDYVNREGETGCRISGLGPLFVVQLQYAPAAGPIRLLSHLEVDWSLSTRLLPAGEAVGCGGEVPVDGEAGVGVLGEVPLG